jgi:hypothetical protein
MGGGGMNIEPAGAMNQWQPGFNQSQLDYIRSQGKLPGALGGGALNPAQQNFFNVKGYLPKGFAGGDDLGQQYYRPQQQQQQQQQQYNPYGTWSGGMPLQQHPFGLGGGYPSQQQLAGSNKGPPAIPL